MIYKTDWTYADVGNKMNGNTEIVLTQAEKTVIANEWNEYGLEKNNNEPTRKLNEIKSIRLKRLKDTDYLALDDVTLTDEMKEYRQGLRDIPQNNTTEAEYDLLLAKVDKKLTHEIWSKP
jgi:hypothetical protein